MRRVIGGWALFLASCGGRTELYAPPLSDASSPSDAADVTVVDAGHDAVVTDAPVDVVPDAPFVFNGRIAAGDAHTCAITASGGVECWGQDFYGELGNGTTGTFTTPQTVVGLTGVTAIAPDIFGTCAVTLAGAVTCWGENSYGQLGNGSFTNSFTPSPVNGISAAIGVGGGGGYATCILLGSGGVSCMGGDYDGNLVLGSITSTTYDTPQTSKVTGAIAIAGSGVGGNVANCAIITDGTVQCWGFMQYSLGDGSTAASGIPFTVPGITNAVQVATSGANICIVLADGSMKCWGQNLWGEVGDGTTNNSTTPVTTTLTNVASVSIGGGHTCALTNAGAVECVGWNEYGQLGNGTTLPLGATTTWQEAISGGVVSVACGTAHTCALTADRKVYCWGDNSFGQVGDGSYAVRDTPVLVTGF